MLCGISDFTARTFEVFDTTRVALYRITCRYVVKMLIKGTPKLWAAVGIYKINYLQSVKERKHDIQRIVRFTIVSLYFRISV